MQRAGIPPQTRSFRSSDSTRSLSTSELLLTQKTKLPCLKRVCLRKPGMLHRKMEAYCESKKRITDDDVAGSPVWDGTAMRVSCHSGESRNPGFSGFCLEFDICLGFGI